MGLVLGTVAACCEDKATSGVAAAINCLHCSQHTGLFAAHRMP